MWAKQKQPITGFTIVELLIVIVIIGILAAITIVAYNGITTKAKIAAIQSDLSQARESIESTNVTQGNYPTSLPSSLQASGGNSYSYQYNSATNGYCLTDGSGSMEYFINNLVTTPSYGTCQNLVGWWPLSATDQDYSGNGSTTTSDTATPNTSNNAYTFSSSSSITISPSASIQPIPGSTGFTFSIWMNYQGASTSSSWPQLLVANTTHKYFGLLTATNGIRPYMEYGNSPYDGSSFSGSPGTLTVTQGAWYMITGCYDATANTTTIYVNGKQYWQGSATINPATGTQPLTIGAGFNGWLKDARIYSRPLTSNEVLALYGTGQ